MSRAKAKSLVARQVVLIEVVDGCCIASWVKPTRSKKINQFHWVISYIEALPTGHQKGACRAGQQGAGPSPDLGENFSKEVEHGAKWEQCFVWLTKWGVAILYFTQSLGQWGSIASRQRQSDDRPHDDLADELFQLAKYQPTSVFPGMDIFFPLNHPFVWFRWQSLWVSWSWCSDWCYHVNGRSSCYNPPILENTSGDCQYRSTYLDGKTSGVLFMRSTNKTTTIAMLPTMCTISSSTTFGEQSGSINDPKYQRRYWHIQHSHDQPHLPVLVLITFHSCP